LNGKTSLFVDFIILRRGGKNHMFFEKQVGLEKDSLTILKVPKHENFEP